MKKSFVILIGILLVVLASSIEVKGSHYAHAWLISQDISVPAGVTKSRGDTFDASTFVTTPFGIDPVDYVAIQVIFSRAAGSASTVNVEFEASCDGGRTWALLRSLDALDEALIQIPTNETAFAGNIVKIIGQARAHGLSHIRLRSVENGDGVNDITRFNVLVSYGYK